MKNLLTIACLFVVTIVVMVSFITPAAFGQGTKTATDAPLASKTVVTSQADGWRTIQFETAQVTAPDVAVTPDGEWLIFTMLGKLFRLSAKGGEAEQLTFGPYYDNDPAISPDGKLVAFQSDRDGTAGNIFVLTLASKEIRQLTREVWADRPNWAPDGKSLVYLRLERESWSVPEWMDILQESMPLPPALVRRVGLAGGEPETIRPMGDVRSVFFLPDGRLSWTVVDRETASKRLTSHVEIQEKNGAVSTMRRFDGVADPVIPSPTGDGIYARYFKWDTPPREPDLLFAPVSGEIERSIVPVSSETSRFAISPDNKTLYLGNSGHLWKVALSGRRRAAIPFRAKVTLAIRESTPPPKWTPVEPGSRPSLRTIQHPELSPDGSRLVFQALGDLWEQPITGGQARRLIEGEGTESNPTFSPDGRQLAYFRRTGSNEEVHVLDFQSGNTRVAAPTTECGWEDLTWSVNGELISSTDCGVYEIIAIDPVKRTQRVLAKTTGWTPYAQLSADGKTLYFQARYPGSDPSLYRLRLGSEAKPEALTPAPRDGSIMKMHGQWIAHPIPHGVGIHLSTVGEGNGSSTNSRVLREPDGREFSFVPDGSALLFVAGNKLWRQPLKGGAPLEIPVRLEPRVPTPPPVLVERVRLLDFSARGFGQETSLLLQNGRIQLISSAIGRELPTGTVTVDGGGRYAIPGLFDMHGHGGGCGGIGNISFGVTSMRNMGGRLESQNAHADRGDLTSDAVPRCFYSGGILEGAQGATGGIHFHPKDEDSARKYVRRWKDNGASFIKFYQHLAWPLQRAAAEEARRQGLPIAAHGNSHELSVKGVTSGYANLTHWVGRSYEDTFKMFVAAGTRWEPTLAAGNGIDILFQNEPERIPRWSRVTPHFRDHASSGLWADRLRSMRLAYLRGITFTPGTDTGPEGLALHLELEFFAETGIPPIDILRFATKEAAKTVGAEYHLGTLEAGKLADLILLDANPLEDIKNTQKIWRVFKGGWMFDPKVLQPNMR